LPTYTGVGGIVVASNPFDPTTTTQTYNVDQSFDWQILVPLEIDLNVNWNVGDPPAKWYVVEGMPAVGSGNPCDTFPCGPSTQSSCSMVYVVATTLANLCTRLTEMRFPNQIKRIRVLNTPAFAPLDPSDPCNTFEEVVEWRTVMECLSYALYSDPVQEMVVDALGYSWQVFGYVGSGGILVGGSAVDVILSYEPIGNGTQGPSFAAIVMGGAAGASVSRYRFIGSGGILSGGSAAWASSGYTYVGSAGVVLAGFARTVSSSFNYGGSGGISLGGFSLPNYGGTGGIILGGSAVVTVTYLNSLSGGIILGGSASISSTAYSWTGSGGTVLAGSAEAGSNFHDVETEMVMEAVIEDLESQFAQVAVEDTLQAATADQATACVCTLPNQLYWTSNLPSTSVLSTFVARNRLTLNSRATLTYNRRSLAWQQNDHLEGLGDRGVRERWDVLYEWACAGNLGTFSQITDSLWKVSLYVVRRALDRSYAETSRVLLIVSSRDMCLVPERFLFQCVVNTLTQEFRPVTTYEVDVDTQIVVDEIGLFGGSWTDDPSLIFGVQAVPFPADGPTLNLTPIYQNV
jgi:hypothetical protein